MHSGTESVVQKLPAMNDSPGLASSLNSQVLAAPASEGGDVEDDLFGDVREGDAIDLRHEVSDGEAEDATPRKSQLIQASRRSWRLRSMRWTTTPIAPGARNALKAVALENRIVLWWAKGMLSLLLIISTSRRG